MLQVTMPCMNEFDRALINRLQLGLPLVPMPWQVIADELQSSPEQVRTRLAELLEQGVLTRFGPLFDIELLGGSFTLAALCVPSTRIAEVTELLALMPEVAHNYLREHEWNMWFVLACEHADGIARSIAEIEQRTGLKVLNLPKEKTYGIGLYLPT